MPRTPITDLTTYADKAPTLLQERFADWLIEQVGVNFATQKEMASFREGVRLSTALRMRYQASDENKAANEEERAQRAVVETAEVAVPAKKVAPAKKAAAVPAKATPAKATPAKTAPAKRGRKPAAAATEDVTVDAPF
jgi:hypothetical protein